MLRNIPSSTGKSIAVLSKTPTTCHFFILTLLTGPIFALVDTTRPLYSFEIPSAGMITFGNTIVAFLPSMNPGLGTTYCISISTGEGKLWLSTTEGFCSAAPTPIIPAKRTVTVSPVCIDMKGTKDRVTLATAPATGGSNVSIVESPTTLRLVSDRP